MPYNEVNGDLIKLALAGEFDVIAHGCNCFCRQKSGLAPQMVKAFGTDTFTLENNNFYGDINKLGQIDAMMFFENTPGVWLNPINGLKALFEEGTKTVIVVNCYTQYKIIRTHPTQTNEYFTDTPPFDYEAFTLCMRKMNHMFGGMHIGLPKIGSHLAGGVWDQDRLDKNLWLQFVDSNYKDIKTIIQTELKDCKVTIVNYQPE